MSASASTSSQIAADGRLADIYADRHERLDNFLVMYALPRQLFSRIGIELLTIRGFALLGATFLLAIFVPTLVIAAAAGSWTDGMLRNLAVSASLAGLNVLALGLAQSAAFKISALHRVLTDESQVRSLVRWDSRWYSPGMSAVMGGSIALAFLVVLYLLNQQVSGIELTATTLWFSAVIAIFLGQFAFSTAMIFVEFRQFTGCRFELYALSPIDTYALQTTAAGLKQLGIISMVMFPLFLLILLSVLPEGSNLNVPITGGFLVLAYLATAAGILFPLGFLGAIVKAEKWRLLNPLQARLSRIAPDVAALSEAQYQEFERLQTLHATISGSKDSFLDLGAVTRVAGAVALSTVTVIATSFVQSYLQRTL